MHLEEIFKEIIDKKHNELNLGRDNKQIFAKIIDFEANAIGQIGETFIKQITATLTNIKEEGTIHNEYDIITEKGVKIEIKTARKGSKNNSFQFNGINPKYNYNFIICLGICPDKLMYRIFLKKDIIYQHKERKNYIIQGDFKRQLVAMNPGNQVNYKLAVQLKDLLDVSNIVDEMKILIEQ